MGGPFGAGFYFYDDEDVCVQLAENRSLSNKGNIIKCNVMIGREQNVSSNKLKEQSFDYQSLRQNGHDSVSQSIGFGIEFVVYNFDQISVEKVEKYDRSS